MFTVSMKKRLILLRMWDYTVANYGGRWDRNGEGRSEYADLSLN